MNKLVRFEWSGRGFRLMVISALYLALTVTGGCRSGGEADSERISPPPRKPSLDAKSTRVVTWPGPEGEPVSKDYQVTVNGKPVFCYTSYRFDRKSERERKIQGNPVSPLSFCYFDFEGGPVSVKVCMLPGLAGRIAACDGEKPDLSRVVIRPLSLNIKPTVHNGDITFSVSKPAYITVEAGGSRRHVLHIFARKPEQSPPKKGNTNVRWFGPGIHHMKPCEIKSGETVYIAGGAVVYVDAEEAERGGTSVRHGVTFDSVAPAFRLKGVKNVRITGRGILCGRKMLDMKRRGFMILCASASNITMEGIIIRENPTWGIVTKYANNVTIRDVKIIGHYVNSDGMDITSSQRVWVHDCFVHVADDNINIKSWKYHITRDISVTGCTLWSDVGCTLGIVHEIMADVSKIRFADSVVLHDTQVEDNKGALTIKLSGPNTIRKVVFENITIEDVSPKASCITVLINNVWMPGDVDHTYAKHGLGKIRDVTFRNITVIPEKRIKIEGFSKKSDIRGIVFENVTIDGKPLSDTLIKKNEWVSEITIK